MANFTASLCGHKSIDYLTASASTFLQISNRSEGPKIATLRARPSGSIVTAEGDVGFAGLQRSLVNDVIPIDFVVVRMRETHRAFLLNGLFVAKSHHVRFPPLLRSVSA